MILPVIQTGGFVLRGFRSLLIQNLLLFDIIIQKNIFFSLYGSYLQFVTCFWTMFINLYLRASILHPDIVLSILIYPVYSIDFYNVIAWQQCDLYYRTGIQCRYFLHQKAINLFRLYVLYQYTNYAVCYATKRANVILRSVASSCINTRSVALLQTSANLAP